MRDDPDDWSPPGAPLPPEDRLWRHPSELGPPPAPPAAPTGPWGRRRTLVAVAVLSGLTGAAATVVSLVAVGTLSPRVVERVERQPVSASPPTTVVRTARAVATGIAPAVVEVTVTDGDDQRRGSGVVVAADGVVVTSAQLVGDADTVLVTWPSGRTSDGRVAGTDPVTGVAALTVEGGGFPTATVDTTEVEPGERAIAVAAWGTSQGPTLTQGLVSAVGTHVDPHGSRLLGLIETDNPVPAWADGAALVDDEGHLRGICLWVADRPGTGLAVPAEVALRVAEDLVADGRVERGWLGVWGHSAPPQGATPAGMAVDQVVAGSPAAVAGLAPGDVVIAIDERRVRSLADVQAHLTLTRPGQEVTVERARGATTSTVTVALDPAP